MKKLKLGESELELMRYVAQHPSCNVREATEHFSSTRKWARTTVLKTFDRLRDKGLLQRQEAEGAYRYSSTLTEAEIEQLLVQQFVSGSMQGSLKSILAYLHDHPQLTDDEIASLRSLVQELDGGNA